MTIGKAHLLALQDLFVCEHCGVCCKIGSSIKLSEFDAENIRSFLKSEEGQGITLEMLHFGSGPDFYFFNTTRPCPLYDQRSCLCSAHAFKPTVCRRYPFLSMFDGDTCFQDLFCCRGAVRALALYLGVELF